MGSMAYQVKTDNLDCYVAVLLHRLPSISSGKHLAALTIFFYHTHLTEKHIIIIIIPHINFVKGTEASDIIVVIITKTLASSDYLSSSLKH